MRMPPYELRGREESYEDGVEYVAVVHITLSHKPTRTTLRARASLQSGS
jgi:hypothetical protein